jgi:hypothetical protein
MAVLSGLQNQILSPAKISVAVYRKVSWGKNIITKEPYKFEKKTEIFVIRE